MRNLDGARVLPARVTSSREGAGCGGALLALLALAAILSAAAPADARVRVFVGGVIGGPWVYPYPAPYYYYPYFPYAYPPEPVPAPGWVPGHWEWRSDATGRPYRVWVPPHLR